MRFFPALVLTLSLSPLLAACGGTADPELEFDHIEVTGETDGLSNLDVEVHVFDADSGEWLGCAGQDQGLEQVDESDVAYDVTAYPEDASGFSIHDSDLFGRNVYFEVIEDDINPCPSAPDTVGGDDVIGVSDAFDGGSLAGHPVDIAFDRVVDLGVVEY